MCHLCKAALDRGDEHEFCQDCGCIICDDIEHEDDLFRKSFVTSSGDLFCSNCGRTVERELERQMEEEEGAYEYFPDPYDEEQPDG